MSNEYSNLALRDLSAARLTQRRDHLLAEIGRERSRSSWLPRRRGAVLALVGALVVVGAGTTAATTGGWLSGPSAPPAVQTDFGSYSPRLGFHPDPGRAVLVAEDGDVSLYATTNEEGGYCTTASAPWKRPETLPTGGTCIGLDQASAPLVAGQVGATSSTSDDGTATFLIAGRSRNPEARSVRFSDPSGRVVVTSLGSSGFFVAAVPITGSPCAKGDWKPTFVVLGTNADELARAPITLGRAVGRGACQFEANLHS